MTFLVQARLEDAIRTRAAYNKWKQPSLSSVAPCKLSYHIICQLLQETVDISDGAYCTRNVRGDSLRAPLASQCLNLCQLEHSTPWVATAT